MKTWTVILCVISLAYWKCLSGDICNTILMANNNVSGFDYLVVVRRTWNDAC